MNIEALISKAAGEAVKALYGMDATEKTTDSTSRLLQFCTLIPSLTLKPLCQNAIRFVVIISSITT